MNDMIVKRSYLEIGQRIAALCDGEDDVISKMATISCEMFHEFDAFHWVGFYRNIDGKTLKIGPYQGSHGCLVIPFGKGVCGTCAESLEAQLVNNVDAFPGHIACSSSTRSEIVLPVFSNDTLLGVFDIDSDNLNEFDAKDVSEITEILRNAF